MTYIRSIPIENRPQTRISNNSQFVSFLLLLLSLRPDCVCAFDYFSFKFRFYLVIPFQPVRFRSFFGFKINWYEKSALFLCGIIAYGDVDAIFHFFFCNFSLLIADSGERSNGCLPLSFCRLSRKASQYDRII